MVKSRLRKLWSNQKFCALWIFTIAKNAIFAAIFTKIINIQTSLATILNLIAIIKILTATEFRTGHSSVPFA
jgi:hypothetical protein